MQRLCQRRVTRNTATSHVTGYTPAHGPPGATTAGALGMPLAILPNIMTQLSLFETAYRSEINLTEEVVGINFKGRWEIHVYDYTREDGTTERAYPRFSHFATPAESLACYFPRSL